jgi:hypothetical protein
VIVVAFQVPVVSVPTEVREELTTVAFNVVPDSVPAGAMTALVPAAVIRPLPLTVKLGMAVDEPKEPVFVLTVARVVAIVPPEAAPVASPVNVMVARSAGTIALKVGCAAAPVVGPANNVLAV